VVTDGRRDDVGVVSREHVAGCRDNEELGARQQLGKTLAHSED